MTRDIALLCALLAACFAPPTAAQDKEQARPRNLAVQGILGEEDGGEDRWAVIIGVSKYQRSGLNLQYADEDARGFRDVLIKHCGFEEDHIRLLLNEDATAMNVRSALGTWLPKVARRGDLVLIYYAGHGAPDQDMNVADDGIRKYLVTHDADPANLYATAVPVDDLSIALMRIRSEKTVVFLDCCYSGSGAAGGVGLSRSYFQDAAVSARMKGGFVDNLARSGRGRGIMTAAQPNEQSWEDPQLRHGLFTYYVIEGLTGKAASDKGIVTDQSLYAYVTEQLADPARGSRKQTPMMSTTSVGGPIALSGATGSGKPASTGKLKVVTSPLDAQVFIDRDPTPYKTPLEREVSRGMHVLNIIKPGYLPIREEVYVPAGRTAFQPYVLQVEETKGDVIVYSRGGALIRVDGREAGQTTGDGLLRIPDLPAGTRTIRIEAAGFSPVERAVTVSAGQSVVVRVEMEKELSGKRGPGASDILAGLRDEGGRFIWQKDGAEMVFVSEGPFIMGRDEDLDSRPRHETSLQAFWIDRCEVTNAQFEQFVKATGYKVTGGWSAPPPERARRPATRVSLADAKAYAAWAGKIIPTEPMWEKAARGTDGRLYPYGGAMNVLFQNIRAYGLKDLLDVGTLGKGASPYGALDMLGNAAEWCDTPYAAYPGNPASSPNFGKGLYVVRGGSYLLPPIKENLTVAMRSFQHPAMGQEDVGFRCAIPLR